MTTRERWLTAGLVLAVVLLVVLPFWQAVRYGDAEAVVRDWVSIEERSGASRNAQGTPTQQALPEVRALLARGDFAAAQRRISALREEEAPQDNKKRGPGLPLDKLWPPKSPERERARQALQTLVEKQSQGYQMRPAQDALLRVADAARSGKRDVALAAFSEAEGLIERATLRPGFRAPKPPPGAPSAVKPGGPPGAGPIVLDAAAIQQIEQIRAQLPQILQSPMVTEPRQRELLQRADSLFGEMLAAARARKDVSAARPPLMQCIQVVLAEKNYDAATKLLSQAEAAIRNAKPLPPGAPAAPPTAGPSSRPGVDGPPMVARPLPPVGPPPSARGPGGRPPGARPPGGLIPGVPPDAGEQLLGALDAIRQMPEPVYQQSRTQLVGMLGPALAAMQGGGATRPAATIGSLLSLAFGKSGEILSVRSGAQNFSTGVAPGGMALLLPGLPPRPLATTVQTGGAGLTTRATLPDGSITLSYRKEGEAIIGVLKTQRKRAGPAATLALTLPLRAAGWRWQVGGASEVIAVDGEYVSRPAADGKTPSATLVGIGTSLSVTAPTAEIALETEPGRLVVRFPIGGGAGITEQEVRFSPASPTNSSASEPPK